MQFLFFILAYYLGLLAHELGHVFAAVLVGWKPVGLTMGWGRGRTVFKIGDMRFMVGKFPLGGFAQTLARNRVRFRLKQIIVAAGGPAVMIGSVIALYHGFKNPYWLAREPDWMQQVMAYVLFFQVLSAARIFFPRYLKLDGQRIPNDSRKILNTLWMKESEINGEYAKHVFLLARFYAGENRLQEGKAMVMESGGAMGSAMDTRMCWVHVLLVTGKGAEARTERELLAKEGVESMSRAMVLDGLASLPIFHGYPDLVEESMGYIDEAIALEPGTITLKGTKGALLIEKGCLDEGIEMLERVRDGSDAVPDKAISEYYLALGFFRKGDVDEARRHLDAGIGIDPRCAVRGRVEAECGVAK